MKSLFSPSLFDLSLSYLSISNPSLSEPSVSHLGNGQFEEEDKKNDSWQYFSRISKERDKKYRGVNFLYRCGDFTMNFLSRSFAVCERNAGHCKK
jgi:hypothetical protein